MEYRRGCNAVSGLDVVLVHPEIPHNTGAIGRVCVGLGARLHLVRPLGFVLDDTHVRRAGLDYWAHLDLAVHDSWEDFLQSAGPGARLHLASTHGSKSMFDTSFRAGDSLVFGAESCGFPSGFYETYADRLMAIPMPGAHARSLNLANAVSVVAYEAFRQLHGAGDHSVLAPGSP